MLTSVRAQAAGDPYLEWWTLHTPHANVHYYKGLEPIAERVGNIIENLHEGMSRELGWAPTQVTEIVLTDNTDSANGSATAFPYNTMRLYVTAPDDMSPLGEHDDWYLELVSHEYTHIMHMDNIRGVPALLNAVVGRTFVPNQTQPRWILEGLAVLNESRHSTAGRMRSSMFDMYLRADVLDNRIMPLDQMSNQPRRWPGGNVWYLYGSRFLGWIADTYGFDTMAHIAADTGSQLVPYGINRAIRRATGRTYEDLYPAWVDYLRSHYAEQLRTVYQRGLREGVQLTRFGQEAASPRFVPQIGRSTQAYAELVYYRADGHDRGGYYRLGLQGPAQLRASEPEMLVRSTGQTSGSFAPDGSFFYSSSEPWQRIYYFDDLHRLPPNTSAPSGLEPSIQRLTEGHRASQPDVSPDGRSIVYTVNHRGTSYLKLADITPEGALADSHTLVPSQAFEQAYSPRFSPDGRFVAYSAWTRGGYRDIRVVDVSTGAYRSLMHDRAIDQTPSFSPDGKFLLFTSDRTGIANVYAYERDSGQLYQVTNVRTGAYQPELSPDGKTLVYVGYTSFGFDLFAMPFSKAQFLPAPEVVPERAELPIEPPMRRFEKTPYNPLPSLRPRALDFDYGPGTFGQALIVRTHGADAVGLHAFDLSANIETEQVVPFATLTYFYNRLPFTYYSSLFRAVGPRKGYRVGNEEPVWMEQTLGWTNGLIYTKPRAFDSQSYSLSYSISRSDGDLPVGRNLDPYSLAGADPVRPTMGVVHVGWAYSNVEQVLYGVGAARGFSLGAAVDIGDEFTAADFSVYGFSYQSTGYVPMPWLQHHTVALHLGGAAATGDYPRRGLYHVGGFLDTNLRDVIRNTIFQGGYVLRGYKPLSFIGSQYHLANVEYRFPILNVDRGLSTLPFFIQRLNGNLFLDYGGSFNDLDVHKWRDQFHTGLGAELWLEMQLGYFSNLHFRIGYAKGYGERAEKGGQKYFVLSAPF